MNSANSKKVYIVIVNYEKWQDTIECLESIFRLNYPQFQVIVVDNASTNQSLQKIKNWANGLTPSFVNTHPTILSLTYPPVQKPISFLEYSQSDSENLYVSSINLSPLILIQSNNNGGFAAGNNIGLNFALSQTDCNYLWLLNNDTVVDPDALSHLVSKMESLYSQGKKIGILGSKLLYYQLPDMLQCAGGSTYNSWTAHTSMIGNMEKDAGQFDRPVHLDLVIGASMFFGKNFLLDVGLLCEDYFIYFEEQDWIERAKRKGWSLDYAWHAKIYHKEGSTIGASMGKVTRFSEFYWLRNKILFTKKFFSPIKVIAIYMTFILTLLNRLRRRQFDRISMILGILFNPDKTYHS
jgi:GT2 family glycosyltransferase